MYKYDINELIGQTFGRWLVIGPSSRDARNTQTIKCRCECGRTVYRAYSQLIANQQGCYVCTRKLTRKENRPYFVRRAAQE